MMKPFKTLTLSTCLLATILSLAACSEAHNPLTTATKHDAGVFLAKASRYAQKTLKWDAATYGAGGAYGICMRKTIPTADCETLYKTMVQYAKSTKAFGSLNVAELTNEQTFEALQDAYQGAAFNLLPY